MTYTEVVAELERYASLWPGTAPIQYANQPNKTYTENWMRMNVLPGDTFTSEVGSGPIDTKVGLVTFQIFTLEGRGWLDAYTIGDQIGIHMQHKRLAGTLWTRAYSPRQVGDGNGWYQLNVDVPYRA